MKNLTKTFLGAASLMAVFAGNAYAADALAPTWALTGAIDIQSDYKFRGVSQNERDPSPQGTLNLTGPDGWYLGAWTSKINWDIPGPNGIPQDDNPSVELDLYAGKHFDLGGTDLNAEAYYYAYPDASQPAGSKKASYLEGIFQLTHAFGPLTLMGTYAVSPEFSLGGGTGNYVEGTATYTLTDWLTVSGNIGHQWVQAAPTDYTHGDLGLTATWKSFALDVRYNTTDLNTANCGFYMPTAHACSGNVVATLTYNMNLLP